MRRKLLSSIVLTALVAVGTYGQTPSTLSIGDDVKMDATNPSSLNGPKDQNPVNHVVELNVDAQTPAVKHAPRKVEAIANMADSLVFYGLKNFDQGSDAAGAPYNVIRFHGAPNTAKFDVADNVEGGSAAFEWQDKFYVLTRDGDTGDDYATVYDASTWEQIGKYTICEGTTTALRQVAAVDPTTGKAYYVHWGEMDWTTYRTARPLMCLDLTTMKAEEVGKIDQIFVQTLFFDNAGQLYGIPYPSGDKNLYKIDKTNASYVKVGALDIPFTTFALAQSAITDPATDKTYWCVPRQAGAGKEAESWIYTIDRSNAHCELVCDMPNDEHLLGLFIRYAAPSAPAAAHDIDYSGNALTFTVPTTTYTTGEALSGDLTAVITVDGTAHELGVTPGQKVSDVLNLSGGNHAISIRIKNAAGLGAERILDNFVGSDAPAAVLNLKFELDGDKAHVTWDAPNASVGGGAFNSDNVVYDVVRYPDETVVASQITATSYSETLPDARGHYYFEVIPYADGAEGEHANSNIFPYGEIWYPPYTESFDYSEDYDSFTDLESDDAGRWTYSSYVKIAYYVGNGAYDAEWNPGGGQGVNDKFVSPKIALKADADYILSYRGVSYDADRVSLYLCGAEATSDSILSLNGYEYDEANDLRNVIFRVPKDGFYRIAWHVNCEWVSNFELDDITVDVYSTDEGPAAVSDIASTAGAKGAINNTLTFTTPTKTYQGNDLAALTKIEVFRGTDTKHPVYTFENPAVGTQLSWYDENVQQGEVKYTVVPFSAAGRGKQAIVTNWVGLDAPAIVDNVKYYLNSDNRLTFTFDPVSEVGYHGGYVDTSDVIYSLMRNDVIQYQSHWNETCNPSAEPVLSDETYEPAEGYQQERKAFMIYAKNSVGTVTTDVFNAITGTPYDTPFEESFANKTTATYPWSLESTTYDYAWGYTTGAGSVVKPYDEDGGMLLYYYGSEQSNTQTMYGPRVSIDGIENPEISFYMYHGFETDEGDLELKLLTNVNDEGWNEAAVVDYNNGADGWARYSIVIPAATAPEGYAKANVQIAFRGKAIDNSAYIFIDDVRIAEATKKDLALVSFTGTKRVEVGDSDNLNIAVSNYGIENSADYSIVLNTTIDGEAQPAKTIFSAAETKTLAPAEVTVYSYPVSYGQEAAGKHYAYSVEIVSDNDQIAADDAAEFNAFVAGNILPTVENFAGTANGNSVTLTWNAPSSNEIQDAVTDGFDDYETFIIDNVGDWKMYDGDGATPVYFGGPSIPNVYTPMAYQVWDPEEAGFSTKTFDSLLPHSGHQYLASWTASNGVDTLTPTDDWLISPDVVPGSEVSVWYRVPNAGSAAQQIHFMYSSTDQEPENFEEVDFDEERVGLDQWTELTYTVPADGKYFAIRHMNDGPSTTVLFIDDVTYTPLYGSTTAVTLKGYNVYRDNKLVSECQSTTTYTDADAANHVYNVTAVWAEGESVFSNPVSIQSIEGINQVAAGKYDKKAVYTVAGVKVGNDASSLKTLPAGLYIVGGKTIVK